MIKDLNSSPYNASKWYKLHWCKVIRVEEWSMRQCYPSILCIASLCVKLHPYYDLDVHILVFILCLYDCCLFATSRRIQLQHQHYNQVPAAMCEHCGQQKLHEQQQQRDEQDAILAMVARNIDYYNDHYNNHNTENHIIEINISNNNNSNSNNNNNSNRRNSNSRTPWSTPRDLISLADNEAGEYESMMPLPHTMQKDQYVTRDTLKRLLFDN